MPYNAQYLIRLMIEIANFKLVDTDTLVKKIFVFLKDRDANNNMNDN